MGCTKCTIETRFGLDETTPCSVNTPAQSPRTPFRPNPDNTPLPSIVHMSLDVSDLVQEKIDEPRYVSSRADAGRASAATTGARSISHDFCQQLLKLLNGLLGAFPERDKLKSWIEFMKGVVLGNDGLEKWAAERWHREMTTYPDGSPRNPTLYQLTLERRLEEVFDAGVWVFEEIDGRGMYYDPDLLPEDKEMLCKHFDKINSLSLIHSTVPRSMQESIDRLHASVDPTQPVTNETAHFLTQKMVGRSEEGLGPVEPAAMEQLLGWARESTAAVPVPMDEEGIPDASAILRHLTSSGSLLHAARNLLGSACKSGDFPPGIDVDGLLQTCIGELGEARGLGDVAAIASRFAQKAAAADGGGAAAGVRM